MDLGIRGFRDSGIKRFSYLGILRDFKGFIEILRDFKRLEGILRNFKVFKAILRELKNLRG